MHHPATPSSRPRLARAVAVGRRYAQGVNDDRLLGLAAETAFFVVLGIFPGLLIAASLLGLLDVVVGADVADRAQSTILSAVDLVLTEEAAGARESIANLFQETRGQLLTFAVLGAMVTLSGAFGVVINALNMAYDTTERRSWLRRRLLGLLMGLVTMVVVALALTVLTIGPLFGRGESLAESLGLGDAFVFAWDVLRLPVLVVGVVLWTATLFHYAPSRRTRWRDALPGALLTTVLWIAASIGFHLYLRIVAGANPVLGAFGGGVIVMTWVYLLSLSLLLGGELNSILRLRRRRSAHEEDDEVPADRPSEG